MTIQISKQIADALGFDIEAAVAEFQQALRDHAESEGQPAPAAHPLVEQIVAAGGAFEIVEAPEVPLPALTRLSKATLWRRCSDAEAEALDLALAAAPVRLRRIFEGAGYLDHSDENFPDLRAGIVAALGEIRADEVLAPES
ncbi:hypothetical protein [Bosea lathyri]|uniref:Uncharacterized protein n=1 Tax=Bosea lathyri TaxID=1036778 RepID=A0A1H6BF72_9HYPH|nr:hypothetical protein [Bosea lathyri]SEG59292.1 hypothetical protein SAMN04488115_107188 [Bosea lathyri]